MEDLPDAVLLFVGRGVDIEVVDLMSFDYQARTKRPIFL
jgi:hypothetical protein